MSELNTVLLSCRYESESTSSSGNKLRLNYENYEVDIGKISLLILLSMFENCFSVRIGLAWTLGGSEWGKIFLNNNSKKFELLVTEIEIEGRVLWREGSLT